MDKETAISGFLKTLFESTSNRISDCDSGVEELFDSDSPFRVVCKCGSAEIDIIGECGHQYGPLTGYQAGSTVMKCRKCGAAITVCHQ